jgi:ferredoxin
LTARFAASKMARHPAKPLRGDAVSGPRFWVLLRVFRSGQTKESRMAHIVAEPCFDCKYTDCVVVCPVDCFYEGDQMLYIHPEECIDCEACVPECPVEAIFHEDNLPDEWKDFTALNAEMSPQCPVINEKKDALEGESCDTSRKKK